MKCKKVSNLVVLSIFVLIGFTVFAEDAFATSFGLSQVKVASLYERVTDGITFGRSIDDVINIFKETNTDLIFRSFFRWEPVPESSTSIMPGYPANYVSEKTSQGYTYAQYGEAINQIKAAKPNIIFVGAIAAQRLNRIEFNDVTFETFTQPQTWEMAFDPNSVNLGGVLGSKEKFQCDAAKSLGWISSLTLCPQTYNPANAPAYFPDITNIAYQELLLSRAKKQIDLGVDAIWIDMLFAQASLIQENAGDPKGSYDAASKIVDEIHAYGYSKYNKHINVGTWQTFVDFPYSPPTVDFVTASPKPEEITGSLNDGNWNTTMSKIKGKMGDIPVFAFIDWGGANSPLTAFSQTLTPEQQRAFLIEADDFFTGKGIIFVYPIHGGTFPVNSPRLSFGQYNIYDSLAPEFQTYETIKELALKKAATPPSTCSDGTPYGQCSSNKPEYCDSGVLVKKCSVCGCPASTPTCNADGSCSAAPPTCFQLNGYICSASQTCGGTWLSASDSSRCCSVPCTTPSGLLVNADFGKNKFTMDTKYGVNLGWSASDPSFNIDPFKGVGDIKSVRVWLNMRDPDYLTHLEERVKKVREIGAEPTINFVNVPDDMADLSCNEQGWNMGVPPKPERMNEFLGIVGNLVTYYKNNYNVKYWEVSNEPNVFWSCPDGTINRYINFYNAVEAKIHEKDPTAFVGGPSLGGTTDESYSWSINKEFTERLLKEANRVDFFSYHYYTNCNAITWTNCIDPGKDTQANADKMMTNINSYDSSAQDAKNKIQAYTGKTPDVDILLVLGEFNNDWSYDPTTNPLIKKQFQAAWYTSAVIHNINSKLGIIQYFAPGCDFGMYCGSTMYPVYYAAKLLGQYAPYSSTVMDSSNSDTEKIEVLAAKTSTNNIVLANKKNQDVTLTVSIAGVNPTSVKAHIKDDTNSQIYDVNLPAKVSQTITMKPYAVWVLEIAGTPVGPAPSTCTLNSVSIAPQCTGGSSTNCEAGEKIKVDVSYSGDCPSTSYIQVDAKSSDGICDIQGSGGDMVGIQTTCTSGACTGYWTIPAVANDCLGKTVSAYAASIWQNGFPGTGTWVAGKSGSFGSFSFAGAAPPTTKTKVLSIYPCACSIDDIVNSYGQGKFDVTCTSYSTFNSGGYDLSQYNLITLDGADCWGGKALDVEEKNNLKNFVNNGGGLVLTHDTLGYDYNYWKELEDVAGIVYDSSVGVCSPDYNCIANPWRVNSGDITQNPYSLADLLPTQTTHITRQRATAATIWYKNTTSGGTDATRFYLATNNYGSGRAAFIQWGHSAYNCDCSGGSLPGAEESKAVINAMNWVSPTCTPANEIIKNTDYPTGSCQSGLSEWSHSTCGATNVCKQGSCNLVDADIITYTLPYGKYARSDTITIPYAIKNVGDTQWCFLTETQITKSDSTDTWPNKYNSVTTGSTTSDSLSYQVSCSDTTGTYSGILYSFTDLIVNGGWQVWGNVNYNFNVVECLNDVDCTNCKGSGYTCQSEKCVYVPTGGLKGEYYDNIGLTGWKLNRTDATVDFNWGSGSPDTSIATDTFSVRWTGRVKADYSETYTFYAYTDDGSRVWIDGNLIVDSWMDQPPTERSGSTYLTAGWHNIKYEYYENGGGAVARLSYSSPSTPKQVIPQDHLEPTPIVVGPTCPIGKKLSVTVTNQKETSCTSDVVFKDNGVEITSCRVLSLTLSPGSTSSQIDCKDLSSSPGTHNIEVTWCGESKTFTYTN